MFSSNRCRQKKSHGRLGRQVVRIALIAVVRDWLGFIKRITASEESFKIDWLLFELLNYVRGCRLCP
jgi:hypothetical protein